MSLSLSHTTPITLSSSLARLLSHHTHHRNISPCTRSCFLACVLGGGRSVASETIVGPIEQVGPGHGPGSGPTGWPSLKLKNPPGTGGLLLSCVIVARKTKNGGKCGLIRYNQRGEKGSSPLKQETPRAKPKCQAGSRSSTTAVNLEQVYAALTASSLPFRTGRSSKRKSTGPS